MFLLSVIWHVEIISVCSPDIRSCANYFISKHFSTSKSSGNLELVECSHVVDAGASSFDTSLAESDLAQTSLRPIRKPALASPTLWHAIPSLRFRECLLFADMAPALTSFRGSSLANA